MIYVIVDNKSGKYLTSRGGEVYNYALSDWYGLFYLNLMEAQVELNMAKNDEWDLVIKSYEEVLKDRELINGDRVVVYNALGLEAFRGILFKTSPKLIVKLDDGGYVGVADKTKVVRERR